MQPETLQQLTQDFTQCLQESSAPSKSFARLKWIQANAEATRSFFSQEVLTHDPTPEGDLDKKIFSVYLILDIIFASAWKKHLTDPATNSLFSIGTKILGEDFKQRAISIHMKVSESDVFTLTASDELQEILCEALDRESIPPESRKTAETKIKRFLRDQVVNLYKDRYRPKTWKAGVRLFLATACITLAIHLYLTQLNGASEYSILTHPFSFWINATVSIVAIPLFLLWIMRSVRTIYSNILHPFRVQKPRGEPNTLPSPLTTTSKS